MVSETTQTEDIVASMLIENTGRHMLDSGGAYGRNWERAQAAVAEVDLTPAQYFKQQREATIDSWGCISVNVFHFVTQACEYNERFDRAWRTWVENGPRTVHDYGTGRKYVDYERFYNAMATADEFIEQLDAKGWTNKNDDFHGTWVNTYNGEDALSQVLQYVCIMLSDDCPWGNGPHVLLSIHGGADVRGGYTDLRAFQSDPFDSPSLFDNARVGMYCDNVEGHRSVPAGQMDFEGKTPPDIYYRVYSDDGGYSWGNDEGHGDPVKDEDSDFPKCPICRNDLSASMY